jgi:hypothetical protein
MALAATHPRRGYLADVGDCAPAIVQPFPHVGVGRRVSTRPTGGERKRRPQLAAAPDRRVTKVNKTSSVAKTFRLHHILSRQHALQHN